MSGPSATAAGAGQRHYRGGAQEIPALEGLRFVSALAVVWFHCQLVSAPVTNGGPPGMWLVRTGFFAVDALFVLSGFAQFLPFAAAGPSGLVRHDWRGYAVRRACRIIPAYYVALVLTALYVGHFSWGPGHTNRVVGVWELVVHAAFLQHVFYGVSGQQGLGVNTAMWTLTAEAAFYVVLPFVVRPFLRHPWVVLSGALAVAMGWRWLVLARARGGTPSVYLASQAPGFAFHFALGMGAALLVVRLRALVDARALDARVRWGALFVAAWAVAALFAWQRAADPVAHAYSQSWALNDRFIWNVAPATAFGLLVAALAVCPAWAHLPLSNPVVRWMGEATYGTYLIHILVMLEVSRRWRHIGHQPMALWEMASLVTVEALLLGRLSYLIVEEPARRFGRAVAARLAVGRAGTGATGSSAGASAGSSAGSSAVTPGRPRTLSFPPRVEPTTPAAHSGAD